MQQAFGFFGKIHGRCGGLGLSRDIRPGRQDIIEDRTQRGVVGLEGQVQQAGTAAYAFKVGVCVQTFNFFEFRGLGFGFGIRGDFVMVIRVAEDIDADSADIGVGHAQITHLA